MIDENPYAPPKSVLEDFGQPEIIAKPTKMQRLFRVVLFPALFALISTVLWSISFLFLRVLNINIFGVVSSLREFFYLYLAIYLFLGIQSTLFSIVMEFFIIGIKNRKIYSLLGGFLIIFPIILIMSIHENKSSLFYSILIVIPMLSSFLTILILNRHISYYNKKNCSGSLTKVA